MKKEKLVLLSSHQLIFLYVLLQIIFICSPTKMFFKCHYVSFSISCSYKTKLLIAFLGKILYLGNCPSLNYLSHASLVFSPVFWSLEIKLLLIILVGSGIFWKSPYIAYHLLNLSKWWIPLITLCNYMKIPKMFCVAKRITVKKWIKCKLLCDITVTILPETHLLFILTQIHLHFNYL